MHIISAADFPLFCSNSARKYLIMPAECSPQKSLIMLEFCGQNSSKPIRWCGLTMWFLVAESLNLSIRLESNEIYAPLTLVKPVILLLFTSVI